MDIETNAILVAGMHRSGTSLVTQILHLHGVAVTGRLEPANEFNVTGYWESADLIKLHDKILDEAHSSWKDVGELPQGWFKSGKSISYASDLAATVLDEFSGAPLFVVKDPRMSRFLPFWEEVLHSRQVGVKVLIAYRNPYAVAKSLQHRDRMHRSRAMLLWARHILDAERFSRHLDRTFVEYDALLEDWEAVIGRVSEDLGLVLPFPSKTVRQDVDAVILDSENHYKRPGLRENAEETEQIAWDIYSLVSAGVQAESRGKLDLLRERLDSYSHWVSPIFSGMDKEIREQSSLIREQKKDLEESSFQLREQEQAIAQLLLEATNRTGVIEGLQLSMQETEAEAARLLDAVQQAEVKLDNLSVDYKRSSEENERLQLACSKARWETDRLRYQAETVAQDLTDKEAEIGLCEEKIRELKRASDEQLLHKEELQSYIVHYQIMLERANSELERVYTGHSWRLTAPFRAVRRWVSMSMEFLVNGMGELCAWVWRCLPIPARTKKKLKTRFFTMTGTRFQNTDVYRAWHAQQCNGQSAIDVPEQFAPGLAEPSFKAIHKKPSTPPGEVDARLIAFYLPQFHCIPENDKWWGEGFTEWANVKPAEPQFEGHYQPHVPGELGYYNLLDEGVQASQVELAKLYGLHGFCFYFYWFGGKRLLEKPIENYFADPGLDLPACLCWANENWSRRWDGLDDDVLIKQDYSPEDDIAFIAHISKYLRNPKYIHVAGRPLIVVYRPLELPNPRATANRWREWCRASGVGEIYLAYTQSFEVADPADYGFDAAIEFPPNNSAPPELTKAVKPCNSNYSGHVYDWRIFLARSRNYVTPDYMLYRSVCPSWDNTARKKERGACFANSNPADYQAWLENAIADTCSRISNKDDRLVFVNAWNEWAEGAHLEPDERYGYAYLDATRKALTKSARSTVGRILLVTHDAHPHGAQLLVLNLAKLYVSMGVTVSILVAGEGPLVEEYRRVAPVKVLAGSKRGLPEYLNSLVAAGYRAAIVNSVASGWLVDSLKAADMKVVSLVHELPSIISSMNLEESANTLVQNSQLIVFASETVREGFAPFNTGIAQSVVLPQGLYKRNNTLLQKGREYCRKKLREKYKLSEQALIVIGVGGADLRKGIDLFVEAASTVAVQNKSVHFIWVGKILEDARSRLKKLLRESPARGNIIIEDCWQDTDIFYGGADVYALTSREDPFPSVVLEAFDSSMPVVAFAGCGGFADVVGDATGCLVNTLDVKAYARALLAILSDPALRGDKGVAAKELVDSQFSFYRYGYRLLELADVPLKRVTAVLPNYNYGEFVAERIAGICNQTYPLYELVILDDSSTDNSVELIDDAIAKLTLPVKFLRNETNSGSVFKQWQKGAELAEGDYVWIAEADDLVEPDFLGVICGQLDNADVVLSYCQSTQMAIDGTHLAPDYFSYTDDVSTRKWREDYTNDGYSEIAEALCVKNTIPNVSAVVFRKNALRSAISELMENSPNVKVTGDWRVYLSVLQQGRIAYSANVLNHHRRHDSSVTSSLEARQHYQEVRDTQLLARKITPVDGTMISVADNYAHHLVEHFGISSNDLQV